MNKNTIFNKFIKGCRRPVSMPIWKWSIIYMIWAIAFFCVVLTILSHFWFMILALICQCLALALTAKWDTESWKNTKEGREYINKYGN